MLKSESTKSDNMDRFILKGLIVSTILLLLTAIGFIIFLSSCNTPQRAEFNPGEQCKDGLVFAWQTNGAVGEGWYIKKTPEGHLIECNDK